VPALDTRLDEIDRQLRAIQAELAPDREAEQAPDREGGPPASLTLTISAGPFPSIEALRAFEHELARLPGVRDVEVRGYEGDDRALIEVLLVAATT
jgi:hypothetical protein